MRNAGLEEAQAGIKIAGWNFNNLRYATEAKKHKSRVLNWSYVMKEIYDQPK